MENEPNRSIKMSIIYNLAGWRWPTNVLLSSHDFLSNFVSYASHRTTTAAVSRFVFFLYSFSPSSYPTRNIFLRVFVYNMGYGGATLIANFFPSSVSIRVIVDCGAFSKMRSRRDFSYYSLLFVINVSLPSVSRRSTNNEFAFTLLKHASRSRYRCTTRWLR